MFKFLFFISLKIIIVILIVITVPISVEAKERLPPWAYYNRTIYPAIHTYGVDSPKGKIPQLSIGIISDVQYAEKEEEGRRHYKLSPSKLSHAVAEMNANRTHLDLVMHLGDLVDSDIQRNGPPMLSILSKLKYPVRHILGNHDYLLTSPAAAAGNSGNGGNSASEEAKLNKHIDDVPKLLNMPRTYYSMLAGKDKKYRLILLDGNDLSFYATKKSDPKRKEAEQMFNNLKKLRAKNAKPFNGGISQEQLLWLKKQLGESCKNGERAVIFIHHPLRPKGDVTNLWNDFVLVNTISTFHCLVAVINGHAHKFMYDFHHTQYRQVHFVTYGGMVQSPFTSFGFAEFYDDELHIHGLIFGRQIEYHLNLAMHAPLPSSENKVEEEEKDSVKTKKRKEIEEKKKRAPTLISPLPTEFGIVISSSSGGTRDSSNRDMLFFIGNDGGNDFLMLWGIPVFSVLFVVILVYLWKNFRGKNFHNPN